MSTELIYTLLTAAIAAYEVIVYKAPVSSTWSLIGKILVALQSLVKAILGEPGTPAPSPETSNEDKTESLQ